VVALIVEAEDTFFRNLCVKFGYGVASVSNAWGRNWSNAQTNYNTNASFNRGDVGYRTWTLDPKVSLPTAAAVNSIELVRAF
ncbi:pilus assembly protein PilQ, partial [Neisseria sp. P0005.S008]